MLLNQTPPERVQLRLRETTPIDLVGVDLPNPQAILNGLRDTVVVIDEHLKVAWCNPAVTTTLGWARADIIGQSIADLVHPEDIDIALTGIGSLRDAHDTYRIGLRARTASGEWKPVSVTGLDHSDDPRIGGMVLTIRGEELITENLSELQRQTYTDLVTGLPNRRSLHDRLSAVKLFDPAKSPDQVVTACVIDIDKFKNFNDIHGHRVGDQILERTARRLQMHTGPGDILARNGGDEFVLVLAGEERSIDGHALAEEIRSSLARPFEIDENVLHLTASVGIAEQTFGSLDPDQLLQHADIALYAAKDRGRDRAVTFDANLALAAQREQSQRTMVRSALADDRLVVYFQPIVNGDLEVVGVESLVRCIETNGSVVEPGDFLASIAGSTMAVQLDHQAFALSCLAARHFENHRPDANLWVSCNIAPHTLAQGDFAARVLDAIECSGAKPTNICIEITETAAFEAGPSSLNALERLHDAGVQIALDDFGTGFSSLAHLLDLPLSKIKIDRTFIALVHENGPQHAITRGATKLAQSLGCAVVAEGVETSTQMAAARELGVDLMQGWFFARAMPFEALLTGIGDPAGS